MSVIALVVAKHVLVAILVMGLGVGFVVVSMLTAIFSVNDLPM